MRKPDYVIAQYYDAEAGREVTHLTEDGVSCSRCGIDVIASGAVPFYLGFDARPTSITMLNDDPHTSWKSLRRPNCRKK